MASGNLGDLEYRKFDPHSKSVKTVSYSNFQIHEGNHYFYKTVIPFNGADNEIQYFMFTTPNTDTRIHANVRFSSSVEMEVSINEGGTVSDNGTTITTFNNDRNSENTPGLTAYAGPTVTTLGTEIWKARSGDGKTPSGVSPSLSYEIVPAKNEMYIYKIQKLVVNTGYIDVDFWWHEDTV